MADETLPERPEKTMRLRIDQQSDAMYLDLAGREIDNSEKVSDGIILDYDKDGNLVGIEVLDAYRKAGDLGTLHRLNLDVPRIAA